MGRRKTDSLDSAAARWAAAKRGRLGLATPGDERRYVASLPATVQATGENATDGSADVLAEAVEAMPPELRGSFASHYVAPSVRPAERAALLRMRYVTYSVALRGARSFVEGYLAAERANGANV